MCADTPDYKATLNLPETDFPMRAGLPAREPAWLARWEEIGIYDRLREGAALARTGENQESREPFTLHDGPPYANGHLHIGHALNKILKDMVVRSQQMMGRDARYIPGWDCHGLPIEWKIEEQYRAKGFDKDKVDTVEFRRECREFAEGWIDVQREEFKRLGVTGNWAQPYLTMDYRAERIIAEEFQKFLMTGTLYLGSKPVMWSPIEKTALAEAEVEYHDKESFTVWVKFRSRISVVQILTPDLWLGRSADNRLLNFTSQSSSGQRRLGRSPRTRQSFTARIFPTGFTKSRTRPRNAGPTRASASSRRQSGRRRDDQSAAGGMGAPRDVDCLTTQAGKNAHPLPRDEGSNGEWDAPRDFRAADFVTDEEGTGFVHCAPSHGMEEYELYRDLGMLDQVITYNVMDDGSFRPDLPFFGGTHILDRKGREGNANKTVIDKLVEVGGLLARGKIKHSYPHSWRSKAPVIYRNTPQWFAAIDREVGDGQDQYGTTIRTRALNSIDQLVAWTPKTGRNRLYSMIENRPDWVLSRQRAWGVPLTCFTKRGAQPTDPDYLLRNEEVNARILAAFEAEGADAWYKEGAKERFLDGIVPPDEWDKVDDILDVWFDSGSTHAFVLRDREDGSEDGLADLYLEGTDQHRGWFHSSMLQACGTIGHAPYRGVLTHGFTLDEKGNKMSKSLGNTIAPEDVTKQYGADILRLWVAQADYTADLRIGPEILKGVADSYRRLRNTMRFMLGALGHFSESDRVEPSEMPELERWVLHRLAELDHTVRTGYAAYDFQGVFQQIFNFCTLDLSAFYFDIRKDALYCDGDTARRRAARTVMDILFHRLTTWLAPVLVFTMEDVWLSRFPGDEDSVHLHDMPATPADWLDEPLAAKWAMVRRARRVVTAALEVQRSDKVIGASLEAAPVVHVRDGATLAALKSVDFADICITSDIVLTGDPRPAEAFRMPEVEDVGVVFERAEGTKCQRCWKILPDVGRHAHPGTCKRCSEALEDREGRAVS